MFFTSSLYYFTIVLFALALFVSIRLNKKKKYEEISIVVYYSLSICIFLSIFSLIEILIVTNRDSAFFIWYELEMFLILCVFTYFYVSFHRKTSEQQNLFFGYVAITIVFSHIIISNLLLSFIPGTIITAFIFALVVIYIKKFNELLKRVYLIFGLGLYIYISSNVFHLLLFSLLALLIVSLIVSLGYRPVNGRILHLYHTTRTYINSFLIEKVKLGQKEFRKKPLFWIGIIKITQIGRKDKLEKEKEKIETWLDDFSRKKLVYRVKIVLNKDNFKFSLVVKAKTKVECEIKTNQLKTNLKSIFDGLDAEISYKKATPNYLYKKEQWWLIKFPKAPYTQQIDLLKRLTTLFGESRNKIKLLIMYKKASPKKVLETRSKIIAMKYKDPTEKNIFLKMWREDLFHLKIYIHYKIIEKGPILKESEHRIMKGQIESLEIPARNVKKKAKIRKVLCGARADFFRGNLFNVRYFTPISFDFTLSEDMPFEAPIGLKRQVIKWDLHEKRPFSFPIGKWIDEYGRKTETYMYCSVDDFVQGSCVIGKMGSGKSYLLGYINKSIKELRSDIGILVINFKRTTEENLYLADKFYAFGKNLEVPYIYTSDKEKMTRSLVDLSKSIMGSIGFKQEGVYACRKTLENYINHYGKPPPSIKLLLELVLRYFLHPDHNYDDKFRSRITSSLRTRIDNFLSSETLIDTIKPSGDFPQWYQDLREGNVVQIELTDDLCNEWEQRLICILILLTVKLLTPQTGEKGLKCLIEIDEVHRMLRKETDSGKEESDDSVAGSQVEKIFERLFSEFRDRGISFLIADQRAEHLRDSAIKLPSLLFLFRQSKDSLKVYSEDPHHIEVVTRLPDRRCVFDKGVSGELFSFETMIYVPEKKLLTDYNSKIENATYLNKVIGNFLDNKVEAKANIPYSKSFHITEILCPKCRNIVKITNSTCPECGAFLVL